MNDYVREWTASAGPVVEALGISGRNESITLQGLAFANQGFTPRKVYNLSILDSAPGRAISMYVIPVPPMPDRPPVLTQ